MSMSSKLKFLLITTTVFLGGFFVLPVVAAASTNVSDLYSTDQHWTLAGSPYIVKVNNSQNGVGMRPGTTLTIDPGVVVKVELNGQIGSGGTVVARGTAQQPIIFTSLFDDAADGEDSDGQGPSSGLLGDWSKISSGGLVDFDHVIFRYSGRGLNLTQASVTNSLFERNGYAFQLSNTAGGGVIENNTILNNDYGFADFFLVSDATNFIRNNNIVDTRFLAARNITPDFPVDMRHNWWGHASGPKHPTLNPNGQGGEISGGILFDPWLQSQVTAEPPQAKRPVLIIPGILGSELYNGNDLIWPDLGEMFDNINDHFLTENLGLDETGVSQNQITVGNVVKKEDFSFIGFSSITAIDIFGHLISDLELNGYEKNSTYFLFPYDWRLDLNSTTADLNQRIEAIKAQTGFDKVDIIAHSMGGLLVKDYMNEYGSQDINKLIFVGTPHLGAPKVAKVLLEGDRFNIPWLEEDRMMELSRNSIPSYQLLPNQTYFDVFTGYLKLSDPGDTAPLNYEGTRTFMLGKGLNPGLFAKAEDEFFEKKLQYFDFSGIDTYNIAGCRLDTQAGYKYVRGNNAIGWISYTSGDETVPLVSADFVNVPATHKFYVKRGKHAVLPSAAGVRDLITQILTGSSIDLSSNVSNSNSFCGIKGKELLWRSPVEVHIYSSGHHTGPIENNGIEYGIDGVGYEIIDGEKFIFLPTDDGQDYQITANGETSGTFDLLISDNDNGAIKETHVFNDIGITPSSVIKLDVADQSADQSLQLDWAGTGNFQTLPENANLVPEQSQDLTPPETQVIVSGTQGQNGWYKSNVEVSLPATDDNSGVLATKYSLDGGQSYQVYIGPLAITKEGSSILKYYSVDKAGNNEATKTLNLHIDKSAPEIQTQFDLTLKDFVFQTTDNLDPDPVISCTQTSCTATDDAGNTTILSFQKTKVLTTKNLKLLSVSYNGTTSSFQPNLLVINLVEKSGSLLDFDQGFWLKSKQVIYIDLNKPKNQSTIYTLKSNGTLTKEVVRGMRFLQLGTEGGNIKANIK